MSNAGLADLLGQTAGTRPIRPDPPRSPLPIPTAAPPAPFAAAPDAPPPMLLPARTVGRPTITADDDRTMRRVHLLARSGQNWMDPETSFTVAGSFTSDSDMLGIAQALQGALQKNWKGFQSIYNDPVLEKKPSNLLFVRQVLNKTLGPIPIADDDLRHIQTQLQGQGYGTGLAVDGVWNTGWSGAWNEWRDKLITSQLAGKQPGGVTAGTALHWLSAVLPKESAHAIVGFGKALPHSLRQLAADVVMAGVQLPTQAVLGPVEALQGKGAAGLRTGARLGDVAGGAVLGKTPEQFAGKLLGLSPEAAKRQVFEGQKAGPAHETPNVATVAGRVFDDTSTALLIASAVGAGTNIARAAGDAFGEGLSRDAAARGPGSIAKTLGRSAESNLFTNIPVLGRTGPWIAKLTDDAGLYYRFRTLAAAPYALPAVRAAGAAVGQAGVLGAEIRGAAAVSGALNKDSTLAQSVQGEHFLDPVDMRLRELSGTAFAHHLSVGLDDLAFFLHPTPGHVLPSETVGQHASTFVDAADRMLGQTGIGAQIERGVQMATNKPTTIAKLVDDAGGETNFLRFWSAKVREHAAAFFAEREIAKLPAEERAPWSREDHIRTTRAYEHQAMRDPAVLEQATHEMLSLNGDDLASRIARQVTTSGVSPVEYTKGGVRDFLAASDVLRTEVLPHAETALVRDPARPIEGAPLGIARVDTLTRQDALREIDGFKTRLDAAVAAKDGEAILGTQSAMEDFMFTHAGVDDRQMRLWTTPGDVLQKMEDWAGHLATDVYPAKNAPAGVRAALDDIAGLGYKPVWGDDIGWMHTDFPMLDVMDGALTRRRRIAEGLGLRPTLAANSTVGQSRYNNVRRSVQAVVDTGKDPLPPHFTPDTLLADLRDRGIVKIGPDPASSAASRLFRNPSQRMVDLYSQAVAGDENIRLSQADVERLGRARAEEDIAGALNLRDIPRKKAVEAMTRLDAEGVPMMSRRSAERYYRAIVKGSQAPVHLVGLAHIEDLVRGSMGFAGEAVPGRLGEAIANTPNRLAQLRDKWRFRLSPYFSIRRIAKTNAKMMLEGVEPTLNPLERMSNAGTLKDDLARVDQLRPDLAKAGEHVDDADRYLLSQDVFGLYNPRHYEAYAAGQWARMGKSDDEIRRLLIKTFEYGTGTTAGRSPLERSVNFVFFPFSFDKTLYRNFGGYLLDHPGQLVVMDRGLRAYTAWSQQAERDGKTNWKDWFTYKGLESHVPVIDEAVRLNAFAHGVSAGEFGGVNAPLLNVFLPQSWASSSASSNTLRRFVPAIKDFQRVWQEGADTTQVAVTAARNLRGSAPTVPVLGSLKAAAKTPDAQRTDAFNGLRTLIADPDIATALDFNKHNRKQRATFGAEWGPVAGQDVTKANIGKLLESKYPAFSYANDVVGSAISHQAELQRYVDNLDPADAHTADYRALIDAATRAGRYISGDRYTLAQAQQATDVVRSYASRFSQSDPKFYAVWKRHFSRTFGPLEQVSG